MKKFISLALVAAMTASLAACGGSSTASSTAAADAETKEEATESTEAAADEAAMTKVEGSAADEDPLGSADASIHFKAGITGSMSGAYAAGLVALRNHLEEMSDGEMTVDIYPSSALGNESQWEHRI